MKNDNGASLVMVLLVIVLFTITAVSLMGITGANIKMSSNEREYQATYYIAESGITYIKDNISKQISEVKDEIKTIEDEAERRKEFFSHVDSRLASLSTDLPEGFFDTTIGGVVPEVEIQIGSGQKVGADTSKYKITSEGKIGEHSRKIITVFYVNYSSTPNNSVSIPKDMAVFTNKKIELSGGASISGPVGTNSSLDNSIKLDGGAGISGDIYVGPGSGTGVINKPDWMNMTNKINIMSSTKAFEMPLFPDYPNYNLISNDRIQRDSSNSYDVVSQGNVNMDSWMTKNYTLKLNQDLTINNITITQDNTLTIDLGNEDRSIVVNNINIPQGHIKISGTGKLSIYVKGNISLGGGSTINKGNEVKNLEMYLKGIKSLELSGGQKIYGSLFAENANITLTGGSGFQGNIITYGNSFNITGGSNVTTQLFYAPNADFSMSGGGSIKGSIIAKSFKASGGANVVYTSVNNGGLSEYLGTGGQSFDTSANVTFDPVKEE